MGASAWRISEASALQSMVAMRNSRPVTAGVAGAAIDGEAGVQQTLAVLAPGSVGCKFSIFMR